MGRHLAYKARREAFRELIDSGMSLARQSPSRFAEVVVALAATAYQSPSITKIDPTELESLAYRYELLDDYLGGPLDEQEIRLGPLDLAPIEMPRLIPPPDESPETEDIDRCGKMEPARDRSKHSSLWKEDTGADTEHDNSLDATVSRESRRQEPNAVEAGSRSEHPELPDIDRKFALLYLLHFHPERRLTRADVDRLAAELKQNLPPNATPTSVGEAAKAAGIPHSHKRHDFLDHIAIVYTPNEMEEFTDSSFAERVDSCADVLGGPGASRPIFKQLYALEQYGFIRITRRFDGGQLTEYFEPTEMGSRLAESFRTVFNSERWRKDELYVINRTRMAPIDAYRKASAASVSFAA